MGGAQLLLERGGLLSWGVGAMGRRWDRVDMVPRANGLHMAVGFRPRMGIRPSPARTILPPTRSTHIISPLARTIRNILPPVPARALLVITPATLRRRAVTTLRRAVVAQRRCHREQKGSAWAGSGWGVRCWGEGMGLGGRKVGLRGKGRDGWKVHVVDPKRFAPSPR